MEEGGQGRTEQDRGGAGNEVERDAVKGMAGRRGAGKGSG